MTTTNEHTERADLLACVLTKAATYGWISVKQAAAMLEAQRPALKPLTDEELADYLGDRYHTMTESDLEFFRLGEAAHGIKEQA